MVAAEKFVSDNKKFKSANNLNMTLCGKTYGIVHQWKEDDQQLTALEHLDLEVQIWKFDTATPSSAALSAL